MAYRFEIRRLEGFKRGNMLGVYPARAAKLIYSGSIPTCNEAGLRVVNNHLAMSADTRHNGRDDIGADVDGERRIAVYQVYWLNKPKGKHAPMFKALKREAY